jgi:hypothetical protein
LARLGPFPAGIVFEGENPLNLLGPPALLIHQNLKSLVDFVHARILADFARPLTPANAIKHSGKVK